MRSCEGQPTGDGPGRARAARYHYDIHRRGAGRLRCLDPHRSEISADCSLDVGVPGEHPAAVVWCGMVFSGNRAVQVHHDPQHGVQSAFACGDAGLRARRGRLPGLRRDIGARDMRQQRAEPGPHAAHGVILRSRSDAYRQASEAFGVVCGFVHRVIRVSGVRQHPARHAVAKQCSGRPLPACFKTERHLLQCNQRNHRRIDP